MPANIASSFAVFENPDTGERKYWNGSSWVMLPNARSPGAALLPGSPKPSNPSAAAQWNNWSKTAGTNYNKALKNLTTDDEAENLLNTQAKQGQGTGGIYGLPVIGSIAAYADPQLRRLDQLQAGSARGMREAGEGSMSDFDAKMFLSMAYSKGAPMETNRAVIRAQRIANNQIIENKAFNDWYYQTYNHRDGADEAWANYVKNNPIFDPKNPDKPTFNEGRKTWREYFGTVRSDQDKQLSLGAQDLKRSAQQSAIPRRGKPGEIVTNSKGERAKWDATGTKLIPLR